MTWVRRERRAGGRRRTHRDLEARSFHLHLGVAGRDDEPTAQRDLGDVGFQRSALDVEPLGRAERGQSRRATRRRRAVGCPFRARARDARRPARARTFRRRSDRRGSPGERRPALRSPPPSRRRRRPPASSPPAHRRARRRPPLRARSTRWTAGYASRPTAAPLPPLPPRPTRSTARDAAVHGRGARARSPRGSPFDPAASSPFPLRRRPRPAGAPWPRVARTAGPSRESSSLPLRPFQLGRQFGIRGDARMQILAPADQTALGRRGADRHDLGHLAQVVTVHVVEQEGPGARPDRCSRGARTRGRSSNAAPRDARADRRRRARTATRRTARAARPCGGECACRRRAPRAWRSRRRAGTRRGNDRSSARPPPSSAGPDPGDPDRSAPAGG